MSSKQMDFLKEAISGFSANSPNCTIMIHPQKWEEFSDIEKLAILSVGVEIEIPDFDRVRAMFPGVASMDVWDPECVYMVPNKVD